MAVPERSIAYVGQSDIDLGLPVAFALDDGNWTESPTVFEVSTLPPGFTIDGAGPREGLNLGGQTECKMVYTIFVRGVNAEGAGDFFPLQWDVASVAVTGRTLHGLPLVWPAAPQIPLGGGPSVIFLQLPGVSPSGPAGLLYVNDIGLDGGISVDGTASKYGPAFKGLQLLPNGIANTFLRATKPGWEVIIDTNG